MTCAKGFLLSEPGTERRSVRLNDVPPGVFNQRYGQVWTVISVKNAVSEYIDLGQRRIPLRRTSLGGSEGPLQPNMWQIASTIRQSPGAFAT